MRSTRSSEAGTPLLRVRANGRRAEIPSLRLHELWQSILEVAHELVDARRARALRRRARRRRRLLETAEKSNRRQQ
jgi:hypothetical protein